MQLSQLPSLATRELSLTENAIPAARRSLSASQSFDRPYAQLDPKLVSAAHQFEASMMAELLKPLNEEGAFGGADEASSGGALSNLTSSAEGSGGAVMSFGAEALAKALSEKGGLGIAREVLDHFEKIRQADSRGLDARATKKAVNGKQTLLK